MSLCTPRNSAIQKLSIIIYYYLLSWVQWEGIKSVLVVGTRGGNQACSCRGYNGRESSLFLSWVQGEGIKPVTVVGTRGGYQACCHGG